MSTRVPPSGGGDGPARNDLRKSQMLSTDEVRSVSHGRDVPIDALDTSTPEIELPTLAEVASPNFDSARFMEEKVTINVHKSNVEGELTHVEPKVNGQSVLIPRGMNVIVKRKFVEALANAKQSNYMQEVLNVDQQNIQTPLNEQVALTYPFTLVQDSQRGREWLTEILNRPA